MRLLIMKPYFWKFYFRRYGALAASVSVIAVFMMFAAVLPASVGASAVEKGVVQEKALGGVNVGLQTLQSVDKPAQKPITYDATPVAIDSASADKKTLIIGPDGEELQYVGSFRITHYCPCAICCGKSNGITATGKHAQVGMCAADWKVFPPHTVLYVKHGDQVVKQVVEDRGGGVNGNHIDVFVPAHSEALQLGTYTADIYLPVS